MAIYKLTPNYEWKYPNVGDLTTVNLWGDVINETLEDVGTKLFDLGTDSVAVNAKLTTAQSSYDDDLTPDYVSATSEKSTLSGHIDTTEESNPIESATESTMLSNLSSVETKYYTTLPALIDAATNTGGMDASDGSFKFLVTGATFYDFTIENGAIQDIDFVEEKLTAIKVTYVQKVGENFTAGTARAGFENQTDADGGTNLKNLTSGSVIDLTSLSINWSDRYNYRIGGANIYRITEIILYKNGVASESQTSLTLTSNISVSKEGHCGFNINPSSRNITKSETAAGVGYPKLIT